MRKTFIFTIVACAVGLVSSFGASAAVPRPEYPRPQFERADWVNLNGEWSYCFDFSKSGFERKLYESKGFDGKITVPFAPQSELSGVGYKDFINEMWYHRKISIPSGWAGRKIMLNFGGVDYIATVYIDGNLVGRHWGGSSSFSLDITKFVSAGSEHNLVVRVEDDERSGEYGQGKQSDKFASYNSHYTRTTGIWQTVWMEPVSAYGLKDAYIIPDLDQGRFVVEPKYYALSEGQKLRVKILDGTKVVSEKTILASEQGRVELDVKNVKTWSPEKPFLYDVELDVLSPSGTVIDHVKSYSGMRKISIIGNKIYLNNEPRYLRFVLDHGYYPDGIWTAPSDEALKKDVELSLAAGFNGARLHQKVFDPRFHYWADKLGYLTWAETASWGADANKPVAARHLLTEWEEIVLRDRNHPSIITWVPLNEVWKKAKEHENFRETVRFVTDVYNLTKNLDYRPCEDASGFYHVMDADIFTVHNYERDPVKFREWLTPKDGKLPQKDIEREVEYAGQPYIVSEYGAVNWQTGRKRIPDNDVRWPKTTEEYYKRVEALTDTILEFSDVICGYCYDKLADSELGRSGIYNYNRTEKFDMEKIRAIFSKVPAGYK